MVCLKKSISPQKLITIITALLLVAAGFFAYMLVSQVLNPYKYSSIENGVEFLSDIQDPAAQLGALAGESLFIVSPEFYDSGTANAYMTSSLVTFSAVLKANNRTVLTIGRLVDAGGNLSSCQTNDGTALANRQISAGECSNWLKSAEYVKIMVSMPDSSLKYHRVVATSGTITITPNSFEGVQSVSFRVLEKMYPNTAEMIGRINQLLAGLT